MASADILRATGPWRIEPQSGGSRGYWIHADGKPTHFIAMSCQQKDRAAEDANARLIAAAPTMLCALKEADSALVEMGRRTGLRFPSTQEVIRAAIAAAEREAGQ